MVKFSVYLNRCFRNESILLPVAAYKITGRVVNSVDRDQMPRAAASDLGLHCLLRDLSVRIRVSTVYLIKSNPVPKKASRMQC